MDLNINSPAYYTRILGVDDEVYWMCRELAKYIKDKEYSPFIHIIGIVPIIAPTEELEKGLFKEEKKCEVKAGFASVSLQMDYIQYTEATTLQKKQLIIENILNSVKAISRRGKIDYSLFERDVKMFVQEYHIFESERFL